jgi:hypothetical protein
MVRNFLLGSFKRRPLAMCTMARKAQVSQEGIGKARQIQVCNNGLTGTVLVLAGPQQLLDVFCTLLNRPRTFVC